MARNANGGGSLSGSYSRGYDSLNSYDKMADMLAHQQRMMEATMKERLMESERNIFKEVEEHIYQAGRRGGKQRAADLVASGRASSLEEAWDAATAMYADPMIGVWESSVTGQRIAHSTPVDQVYSQEYTPSSTTDKDGIVTDPDGTKWYPEHSYPPKLKPGEVLERDPSRRMSKIVKPLEWLTEQVDKTRLASGLPEAPDLKVGAYLEDGSSWHGQDWDGYRDWIKARLHKMDKQVAEGLVAQAMKAYSWKPSHIFGPISHV